MSNEPKWTNGPWSVSVTTAKFGGWREPEQIISVHSGSVVIAHYSTSAGEYPSDARCEANARLIAAAPELYEALADLLASAETDGQDGKGWLRNIREARRTLAKARGEP